ncbi:Uncharacterized protein Rs2_18764 [Raphanus sativus]|nr:Uncharacterized protein Rs2_18764 [Raphanus sativus]
MITQTDLGDMNSPKRRTDGMNGDTKGCGRPNDTTRGALLSSDMTHRITQTDLGDMNLPKGRTDGMNGDTKGCGRPNDTTRGALLSPDMTHRAHQPPDDGKINGGQVQLDMGVQHIVVLPDSVKDRASVRFNASQYECA